MADDIDDADAILSQDPSPENHPYGAILLRIIRLLKGPFRSRLAAHEQRLNELEARVTALEGP